QSAAQAQGLALTLQAVNDRRQGRPAGQSEQRLPAQVRPRIEADGHVIEVRDLDPAGVQAVADGSGRETCPMFDAVESFLLDSADELAIHHQRSGGVTVISVKAE